MKKIISLAIVLLSFASFGQDKTPVLSEMGAVNSEQIAREEPRLAESDPVIVDENTQKRKKVRKTRKMPAMAESEKVEIEVDAPTIDN